MKNVSCSAILPYVCNINILHKHFVELLFCEPNEALQANKYIKLLLASFQIPWKIIFFILLHLMLFAMLSCQHLDLFSLLLFFWRRIMLSTFILKYPTSFYFLCSIFPKVSLKNCEFKRFKKRFPFFSVVK